jgi:hypothetical protein
MKWQADRLVERFRRECRQVSAGLTDPAELPGRLWNLLADWDRVAPEVVPRLWAQVPASVRELVASACRSAACPDFRLPPWLRDGQPMTWAELEADAEIRSARVRVWAAEFGRVLTAAEQRHAEGGAR